MDFGTVLFVEVGIETHYGISYDKLRLRQYQTIHIYYLIPRI